MLLVKHKVKTQLPIIEIKADTIIYQEGWDDYKMFFVVEGAVKVYYEQNNTEITIINVKKHEFFGEVEMYSKCPRKSSAKITADSKLVVIRSPLELEKFVNDNRWLIGKIMHTMGERLAISNELLVKKIISQIKKVPVVKPVLEAEKDVHSIRRVIRH
jgi:CRP-like cAMP-binding protein